MVTIIAVVGVIPYIALQLKAVSGSFTILLRYPDVGSPANVGVDQRSSATPRCTSR